MLLDSLQLGRSKITLTQTTTHPKYLIILRETLVQHEFCCLV